MQNPARGRAGGENGAPGEIYLDADKPLHGKGQVRIPAGKTLTFKTPGGGGFGLAENRLAEAIELDRASGYVSEK